MKRPTEQEFADYRKSLTAKLVDGREAYRAKLAELEDDIEQVGRFLEEVADSNRALLPTIETHKVWLWIDAQRTSARAFQALAGKRRKTDPLTSRAQQIVDGARKLWTVERYKEAMPADLIAKRSVAELKSRVEQMNRGEEVMGRIRRRCENYARWPFPALALGVAYAFESYFYSDRHKRVVVDAKSAVSYSRSLQRMIQELKSATSKNMFVSVRINHYWLDIAERRLAEFEREFDPTRLPIRRLDETARERLLAFDLWQTFYAELRANRTKAISLMMEFDGVEKPIEMRTLERMAAGWKSSRASRSLMPLRNQI